jgi:hypothetical protein
MVSQKLESVEDTWSKEVLSISHFPGLGMRNYYATEFTIIYSIKKTATPKRYRVQFWRGDN